MLLTVVILAFISPRVDKKTAGEVRGPVPSNPESPDEPADHDPEAEEASFPIVLRSDAGIEQNFTENDLKRAMDTAMGGRGWVELRNRKPLKFISSTNIPLDLQTASGQISVRAAPGFEPILEVELKSSKPLIALGSAVTLRLSGVTIIAHYPQDVVRSGSGSPVGTNSPVADIAPPVISAAGNLKIDRCAFRVGSGPRLKGCRAIFSNMGALEVNRCWIEGFDKAIDVAADHRTHMKISQTMIVPTAMHSLIQARGGDLYGWGVRIKFSGDPRPQIKGAEPNVLLDRCTVDGAGLLDMTATTDHSRIDIVAKDCAVRGDTLLALNRNRSPSDQVHWQGDGNRYDVHGRSWIVISATAGTPLLSLAVTDLKSWQNLAHDEKNPVEVKLKYQIDPAARPETLRPRDFAIEASGLAQSHTGASPERVGPWSYP